MPIARPVFRWLQDLARHKGFQVEFVNATEEMGVLSIAGPRSWDLLKKLTTQDVSKFPFLSARQVKGMKENDG